MQKYIDSQALAANSENVSSFNFQPVFSGGISADKLFDERMEKIIRLEVWNMTRDSSLFPPCEDTKLRQALRIHLLQNMPKFDPQKSSVYTYATLVCGRKAKNMIRDRIRELQMAPTTVSLDEVCNDEGETLGDRIPAEDTVAQMDTREEIELTLDQLSEKDRQICKMIMGGMSLKEIARTLKQPWKTFHDYFRKHLVPTFKANYGGAR